jgi:hypothetical protein
MKMLILKLESWLIHWLGESPMASLVTDVTLVVIVVLLFWLIYSLIFRLFRKLSLRILSSDGGASPLRIQDQDILSAREVANIFNWAFKSISWILRLIIVISFISTMLALFSWSRALSEIITNMFLNVMATLWGAFAGYLPGSDSPAFKGVSLFFGLLFSLGSTTAVANVVAGVVITYTRAFRMGDYVNIADVEGKIVERTAFVTRIRTYKNVDVSLPNQAVLSGKVINYSIQGERQGIKLHTSVTIGYDVPWPKVQELLICAAKVTEHIEEDPAPFVLQTSLDDSYVAYELNATTKKVVLRPKIYSALHWPSRQSFRGKQARQVTVICIGFTNLRNRKDSIWRVPTTSLFLRLPFQLHHRWISNFRELSGVAD